MLHNYPVGEAGRETALQRRAVDHAGLWEFHGFRALVSDGKLLTRSNWRPGVIAARLLELLAAEAIRATRRPRALTPRRARP